MTSPGKPSHTPTAADGRCGPGQLLFDDDPQQPVERLGTGFVDGFKDDLSEAFLALRSEEEPLHELPAFFSAGSEEADNDMAAHDPDWVVTIADPDERVEHLTASLASGVDRSSEQRAYGRVGPGLLL